MLDWFTATVDWLAQWAPRPIATAILLSILWFVVAVPLIKLMAAADLSWWRRSAYQNRKWILILVIAGLALLVRGTNIGFSDFIIVGVAALLAAGSFAAWQYRSARKTEALQSALWRTQAETHPGYRVITWTQLVDTGLQQKDLLNRAELKFMTGTLAGGPLVGWVLGGAEGALVGLGLAWFLLPAATRRAVAPKVENVGGHAPMPGTWSERQPNEIERQIEAEPVIEVWEAQAFVDTLDGTDMFTGTPYMTVQWRNPTTGEIRLKCHEKWTTLSAFEFDAADRFFADPVTPRKYRSPQVIITRSTSGKLIELARDMTGTDHLQPRFKELDEEFGPDRRHRFNLERDHVRRQRANEKPADAPSSPPDETIPAVRQMPTL